MSMKITPYDYFKNFIIDNYEDFKKESSSLRKAFNTVVPSSQLADIIYNYYYQRNNNLERQYPTIGSYIKKINNKTNYLFRDIRSIANAYKHLYTGIEDKYSKYSSISSMGTIELISLEDNFIQEISKEHEKKMNIIIYTRKNGDKKKLEGALSHIIKFWENEINNMNDNYEI